MQRLVSRPFRKAPISDDERHRGISGSRHLFIMLRTKLLIEHMERNGNPGSSILPARPAAVTPDAPLAFISLSGADEVLGKSAETEPPE